MSVWATLGVLPALQDREGVSYDSVPCEVNPRWWDEDATDTQQQTASRLCVLECPAFTACDQRRADLGDLATGVWAGKILPKRIDDRTPHDATVAALWAAISDGPPRGSKMPKPETRQRAAATCYASGKTYEQVAARISARFDLEYYDARDAFHDVQQWTAHRAG